MTHNKVAKSSRAAIVRKGSPLAKAQGAEVWPLTTGWEALRTEYGAVKLMRLRRAEGQPYSLLPVDADELEVRHGVGLIGVE